MSFNFFDMGHKVPEESYSRQLDRRIACDEFPYGYDTETPSTEYLLQRGDCKNEVSKPKKGKLYN